MRENTSLRQRGAAQVVAFFVVALLLAAGGGASRGWLAFWAIGLAWAVFRLWRRRKDSPYDQFYKPWRPD